MTKNNSDNSIIFWLFLLPLLFIFAPMLAMFVIPFVVFYDNKSKNKEQIQEEKKEAVPSFIEALSPPMLRWYFSVLLGLFVAFAIFFKNVFSFIYEVFIYCIKIMGTVLENSVLIDKLPIDEIFTLSNLIDVHSSFYKVLLQGFSFSFPSHTLFGMAFLMTCLLFFDILEKIIRVHREMNKKSTE